MERRLPRLLPPFKLHATVLALLALALLIAAVAPRARAQERRPVDEVPQSRVFGRIVDSKGAAVSGAKVELHSVGEPWRPGEKRERFEVASDASGKFEFTVPTPTCDWVALFVQPGPYLDIAGRDFGPAGGRDQPRLKAGGNDLGTFELKPTGAYAGRVTDAQGKPVPDAQVRLDGSFPGGMGRQARSNERGEFELGHVPPGTYGLEVLAEGFQLAKLAGKTVTADVTTTGIDFVLARANTISGFVLNENGIGIADAWVWGWPQGSGTGSGARTDANGHFVVHLKQDAPHVFEVEAEGFAKLDSFGSRGTYHTQGASDVRLVLKRPTLTRFIVLDGATSAPVTEYAVRLDWKVIGNSHRSGGEPEFPRANHPDGEFECEADPRRHTYVITAPGYGPARGEIVHDSTDTRRCIVRLSKGGALVGQVTVGGKPVEDAEVILRETTLAEINYEPVADENDAYWSDWEGVWDPFLFDETERKSPSDAEGRFRFDSLDPGDYRLEIKTESGERRSLEPVRITPGEPLDLGPVELRLAAVLQGRVVTPPGTSSAGLRVSASVFDVTRSTKTDAEGRFRIATLPAGRAHVHIESKAGVLNWFRTQHFELAPEETKEVLLDASACAGATLSIVARIDGKPAAGLDVFCSSTAGDKRFARLNDTDRNGASSAWISAIGEADVELTAPSRMLVATLPKAALLTPGADVKLDLDLAVGQLAFEWPALPPGERLRQVEFDGKRADREAHVSPVWFLRSAMDTDFVRRSDQRCEFRWVQPGACEWTVRVLSSSATDESISRYYRRSATVVAGALAECRFEASHAIPKPPEED